MGIQPEKILVIDTETTGLTPGKDEILQLSIIDGNGNTIFNEKFKPIHRKTWKKAEEINGISPSDVKNCKSAESFEEEVIEIFNGDYSLLVGYNLEFDLQFIKETFNVNIDKYSQWDVMKEFAPIYGHYSERHGDYVYKSLEVCARNYKYKWEGEQHDALADCKATLFCFYKILQQKREETQKRLEEKRIREEAEQKAQEEAERRAQEEAERKAKKRATIMKPIKIIIGGILGLFALFMLLGVLIVPQDKMFYTIAFIVCGIPSFFLLKSAFKKK